MKTNKLTLYALIISVAMILSYVESLIPAFVPIPGIKLGLANIATVFALYKLDTKAAVIISVIRITLSSLLFSGLFSIIYSISGAFLSLFAMHILIKSKKFSPVGVSVSGAVCHNLGQVITAALIMQTSKLMYYFAALLLSGIISGTVIGIAAGLIIQRIK